MKRILHIALLCLSFIAFSQVQKVSRNTTINVYTIFGRKGGDCFGRGICSFSETENKALENMQLNYNKNNTITLVIDRNKITKEDEIKIVGHSLIEDSKANDVTFIMETDFEIPFSIKSILQVPKQLTKIPKGNYPIAIAQNNFFITITLK